MTASRPPFPASAAGTAPTGSAFPALYECRITHVRTAPLRNRFRYGTYLWLADLAHLPQPGPLLRPLAGFSARDHLGDPHRTIRSNLDGFLAARGVDLGGGRVLMLAHARVFGYVFNPLTVYWCHRADGTLACACVVAEVHNTYGQRHAYLLRTDDRGRAQVAKEFYVSPYYPVDGSYRMTLPEPGACLGLSVVLDRPGGESFVASVHGRRAWPANPGHPAWPARFRRPPSLVDRGRGGPDPLAGHQAVCTRAAHRRAATEYRAEGSFMTRISIRPAVPATARQAWCPELPAGGSAVRAGVARVLFTRAVTRLPVRVRFPDGRLPAEFYQLILDPAMAYSSAYWTSDAPGYTLTDAQHDKLALICGKLALAPGARLLDLGCGWGSLAIHAACEHQARVTAVTLSAEQGRFVAGRVRGLGLEHLVEVRVQDWRDTAGGGYDAIACVEMGEHVGAGNYPRFCAALRDFARPGGRILIQQMSRSARAPGGGPFIEAFITADMHMRPVGGTVGLLEQAGLEVLGVQALREHYVRTIRAWAASFEQRLPEVTALLGAERVRVWRLYLAGGALAFEAGRMGVDQILAVRR